MMLDILESDGEDEAILKFVEAGIKRGHGSKDEEKFQDVNGDSCIEDDSSHRFKGFWKDLGHRWLKLMRGDREGVEAWLDSRGIWTT